MRRPLLLIGALLLIIAGAAVVFFGARVAWPKARLAPTQTAQRSNVAAATSTADLGPTLEMATSVHAALEMEGWNINPDHALNDPLPVAGDLDGTVRTHETSGSRADSHIKPVITEFRIADQTALIHAAISLDHQKKSIGHRNGYLLTIPGAVPSSAFVLIGKNKVLFVQFSLRDSDNLMAWNATDPAPELARLIQRLPLE